MIAGRDTAVRKGENTEGKIVSKTPIRPRKERDQGLVRGKEKERDQGLGKSKKNDCIVMQFQILN